MDPDEAAGEERYNGKEGEAAQAAQVANNNTETVSVKKRRGRPRLALDAEAGVEQDEEYPQYWLTEHGDGESITRRHALNLSYRERAIQALDGETFPDDKGHPWPLETVLEQVGERARGGLTGVAVLAELGRHGSRDEIVASARALLEACLNDPKAVINTQGDALRWLRARRLGTEPRTTDQLEQTLQSAIEAYRRRYPDCAPEDVLDPLARLWHQYRALLLPDYKEK